MVTAGPASDVLKSSLINGFLMVFTVTNYVAVVVQNFLKLIYQKSLILPNEESPLQVVPSPLISL
jgi:hypothetical protein